MFTHFRTIALALLAAFGLAGASAAQILPPPPGTGGTGDVGSGGDSALHETPGRGQLDRPALVVHYHVEGGFAAVRETDLRIQDDGAASLRERFAGAEKAWQGRLEAEEVAGLRAAIAELAEKKSVRSSRDGADLYERSLFAPEFGAIDGSAKDPETAYAVAWLESLSLMIRRGHLDDSNKLFEAKLARPDVGDLAVSGVTVTRDTRTEIRFEIAADGRRTERNGDVLSKPELMAVLQMIAIADPANAPSTPALADAELADAYVLRFWAVLDPDARRDVHPFVEVVPGIPALEILRYLVAS
jgi:hypothetical protein